MRFLLLVFLLAPLAVLGDFLASRVPKLSEPPNRLTGPKHHLRDDTSGGATAVLGINEDGTVVELQNVKTIVIKQTKGNRLKEAGRGWGDLKMMFG